MYEQNRARDHFSDIRFATAYPRTLSLTFSRSNGSELFFNDLQRCCRVIITTLVFLSLSLSLSFFLHLRTRLLMEIAHRQTARNIESRPKISDCINARNLSAILEDSSLLLQATTSNTIVKVSILNQRPFINIYVNVISKHLQSKSESRILTKF